MQFRELLFGASAWLILSSAPLLAALPSGPYQKSCTAAIIQGDTLSAQCMGPFGVLVPAFLEQAAECHNIRNVNGALRCVVSSRAVTVNGANPAEFDIVSLTHVKSASQDIDIWHIDQPDPTHVSTVYPQITFRPGDRVSVNANGCVQTGGFGKTWKLYVNPQGTNAGGLYSGQFQIPGVTGGLQPIAASIANSPLTVPADLKFTVRSEMFLWLGYIDDNRSDNGYWSHDDGTGDQCKGVGPAWVEVSVSHNPKAPPAGLVWSPHRQPFDLIWDTNNTDYNGLPMNPMWAAQLVKPKPVTPPLLSPLPLPLPPNFTNQCQSAFSMAIPQPMLGTNYSGNPDVINRTRLSQVCTTQDPYTDLRGYSAFDDSGLCASNLLHGHLDWMIATYTGQITWDHFSGHWPHDRDYNMKLFRADQNGLTADNVAVDDITNVANFFLGLEFDAGEVVDNLTTPWWNQLAGFEPYLSPADGSMNPDQDPAAERFMNGPTGMFGVVTGLIGLDAIHGAPTESHPVFSMALLTQQAEVLGENKVDETWSFFLRNSGDEGECSQLTHFWDGLGGLYFVQFPWPSGATSMQVLTKTIVPWQKDKVKIHGFEQDAANGMTLLKVEMPKGGGFGLDGQIVLRYTLKSGAHREPPPARGVKPRPEEPETGLAEISQKIADPSVRQKFEAELRALEPKATAPTNHVPADVGSTVVAHQRIASPAAQGKATRTRTVTDPARAKLLSDTNALLLKYRTSITPSRASH